LFQRLARLATVAAAAAIAAPAPAQSELTAPDVLVKNVTLEVVEIIRTDKDIQSGGAAAKKKMIALIEAKILPHFNFQAMTSSAVGRNWNKANAEQKARLSEEFKTLLVRTYSSALTAYRDQQFEFRPLRAKPTDTDVTVNVRVIQPGAQPVTIDYDMEKRPNGWKAWDVRIAGVSLVVNYRTEFDNLVRDGGIEGLIKALRAKNSSLDPAVAATSTETQKK